MFDAGSFYAHNEYEIGNWRAARHRFSRDIYVENYKRNLPPSEPSMSTCHDEPLSPSLFSLGSAGRILPKKTGFG